MKAQPTNSIDSELEEILGEYVYKITALGYDENGSTTAIAEALQAIKVLYRKEIEEALKDRVCTLCRDNTRLSHKGSNYIGSCPVENENLLLAELRAKLLPLTKGGNE